MRSEPIVFLSPVLDKYLCLHQGIQNLLIEKLTPKLPDIRLNAAIVPRASGKGIGFPLRSIINDLKLVTV